MAEMIQRAGWAVYDPNMNGLLLAMVEAWVFDLELNNGRTIDPDKPYAEVLKKNSSKQD